MVLVIGLMVLFWGGLALLVVWLVRRRDRSAVTPPAEPVRMLDERFARGEIDEADYQRRRDLLRDGER